jgi:hypothetical protein
MAGYQERREARYAQVGQAVGGILKDRWDGKEAEEFIQNELATYQATSGEFRNQLSTIDDGDQMASAFSKWQSDTTAWSAAATARYSGNSRIMQIVKDIMDKQMESLGQFIQIEEYGHKKGQRDEMEERATETHEAGLGLTKAQTGQAGGAEEASRASAVESRARAAKISSSPDLTKFPQVGSTMPLDQVRLAVKNARVSHGEEIARIETRIDQRAVNGALQRRLGELKDDGTKWGADTAKDTEDIKSEWAGNPARDKTLEGGIAQELGYDLENSQGYFDDVAPFLGGDVRTPNERVRLIKSGTPTRNVLSRIFVQTTKDLEERGWDIETPESFIKNTLADLDTTAGGYQQLGENVTTLFEQAVKKRMVYDPKTETKKEMIVATDGTPVRTYNELVQHLLAFWGAETSTKLFDPNATKQKEDAAKVGLAMVLKFAPVTASRLGIDLPPKLSKKLQRESDPAFLRLLKGAGDFLKGAPGFFEPEGREEL